MAPTTSSTTSSLAAVLLLCTAASAFFSVADAKATTADGPPAEARLGWLPDDVCESRLRQDKRSAAAKHPRDLALIAMSLAQHAVVDAEAKVYDCVMDYATVASAIPVCSAMHQLAPVDYFDCARRLRRGTAKCWFRKLVIKEVYEALYRTELVAAMVEEMLGIVIKDHEPPQWI
ncbi:hypothetical protein HU200_059446 [Digitaria exilis]|uniref:Pectinesterase inhibitor domain-containing protein n=1 Tax=Digitaria exilis TaxID=1010633 RepID=A0A835E192_9POAL|nr:hypothetical protein HU200_059446 [Digitaria exilis]